jgi:peptide/nickel transport system substrate-binding protein
VEGVAAQQNRTLSVIMRVEPPEMLGGADDRAHVHKPLFSATLAVWDQKGSPSPVLAETLPQLNTESWRVLPDGRMETVYRLRAGLTWHDGVPLTAEDVVFTQRVDQARSNWGLSTASYEHRQIEDVLAPDARTVVIRWRQPFVEAPSPELVPVPRHVLAAALDRGDAEAFGNLPYWSTGFVGAGPYALERWEPGAFIEGVAFPGYALGKPIINRVRLTWNNDPNVSLTRLISGDADIALDGSLRFEQASVVRQQWGSNGVVLLSPTSLRYIQTQARPDYVSPRALLDVRARRALLHSIDRAALAEAMVEDRSMVADTVPPPTVGYYAALEQTVAKYPFDPRRAQQLLAEIGYPKAPDGVYTSPTEGRFRLEVRGVSSGSEERDTTIVADQLREAGFDPTILLLPSSARSVDDKMKGTFPALTLNNNTLSRRDLGLDKWLSARIGSPENDWIGGNRMGWSNPEFDRLFDAWSTTLDLAQATDIMVQMMRLLSEEMPHLPLYYNFQVVAHTGALTGPQPPQPEATRFANIAQWAWK